MSLSTFSELKTAIAAWRARSGDTAFVAAVPDFITLFEARANERLRVRRMEASTDLSPSSGVYTVPTDYLEWRRVTAKTSPRRTLEFMSSDQIDWRYPNREAGYPSFFTIEGATLTVLPSTASDVEFLYYSKIPALSDSTTTNWLLTGHPGAYLNGALMESCLWDHDDAGAQRYALAMESALQSVKAQDMGERFAGGQAYARMATP